MAATAGGNVKAPAKARPPAGRALDMDDQQFAAWRRLIERRLGLFIAPERRSFLASGIRVRMRETGCDSSGEYYAQLTDDALPDTEWTLLTDQLTVHETSFFRHEESMHLTLDALGSGGHPDRESPRIWSVGCASGEEVYSLAMLLDDCDALEGGYALMGTDISQPSLDRARSGVYLKRRLRDIPQRFQEAYCEPVSANHFQISDALRSRVTFSQLNLRDLGRVPLNRVDLIYCQNLLIYYGREQRKSIVCALADLLWPGGTMILGPGELLDWQHPNMERVRDNDTLAYRRTQ